MNINKIKKAIDLACIEVENLEINSKSNKRALSDVKLVMALLLEQLDKNPSNINIRILRAMHDIGMSGYKDFENTELENKINYLTELLFAEIPIYRSLTPLRSDFGNAYPV